MNKEFDKMVAGKMYNPADPLLTKMRENARRLVRLYNQTMETEMEN
ncbi:acetyltransferase, partial [Virgibacillus halodenitrificans]|nr:acetyltransferase [Virgibacillus halodenitrificans]